MNIFIYIHKMEESSTVFLSTVERAYNDIGLYDTSPIPSDILWYQLIRHC
jgi:hypothetical protein